MENATKALLIAASVLIVIVLIAIGIKILSSASDVTNQVNEVSSSMAVSIFNSQFTPYLTTSSSATQTKDFISKVISNNTNSKHKITIYCPDTGSYMHSSAINLLQNLYNNINSASTYKICITPNCNTYTNGYDSAGYIGCITISKNS